MQHDGAASQGHRLLKLPITLLFIKPCLEASSFADQGAISDLVLALVDEDSLRG